VRAARLAGAYARIVYAGDGANDVCAALCLGEADCVLARAGSPLAAYCAAAGRREAGTLPLKARTVRVWADHEQLRQMVADLLAAAP
jgi:hypothetical protein